VATVPLAGGEDDIPDENRCDTGVRPVRALIEGAFMYLHQTAAELMSRSVLALPINTRIVELKGQNLPHFVVVLDEWAQPVGVLLNIPLMRVLQVIPVLGESLAVLRSHFLLPAVASVSTPVASILQGVTYEKTARWHVVMDSGSVVGVVTPETLYAELSLHPEYRGTLLVSRSLETFGHTSPPPDMWYKCALGYKHHPSETRVEGLVRKCLKHHQPVTEYIRNEGSA
jgi:hypothetical protein